MSCMVFQTAGSNATEVNQNIDKFLDEARKDLPKGVELTQMMSSNDFLFASIHEVVKTLIEAIILVILVVYVFLQDFRSTLIPLVGIVVSLVGTFAFMAIAGFSINLLTLFALVLVIGTVVDDAIIVVEAVQARFDVGYRSSYMASIDATVMERKIHSWLNCIEGVMHTGQRDMIRIRISKADFEAGFKFRHLGEVLYAKVKSEFEAVVDKCQVKIVVDPEKNKELRAGANEVFDRRDARLSSMTDESVDQFYTCIMCQAFSPSHVCIVTPERLGLCGAVSWLDAKATKELDPNGPCQIVPKTGCTDERLGAYESVNEAVSKYSHGALERVTLYSLFQDPMTSCGCFECICGVEPVSMGVVITCREHAGMTPLGMTFSEMASMTGGGVQTPGFMGHGKHFIASKKFIAAEGGMGRIVWLPKLLKDQMRDRIDATAKELYGVDNFTDMIADETICTEDPEALMNYLTEVGHPVLSMEPFDM